MATIQRKKGLIRFDQKEWRLRGPNAARVASSFGAIEFNGRCEGKHAAHHFVRGDDFVHAAIAGQRAFLAVVDFSRRMFDDHLSGDLRGHA